MPEKSISGTEERVTFTLAGALAVVIVALRTGSLPAAMVTGVGTVLVLRALEANLL